VLVSRTAKRAVGCRSLKGKQILNPLPVCMVSLNRHSPASMGQKLNPIQAKIDLLRLMIDSQNRAALMLEMAETEDGETERLYRKLAETFRFSAELIVELRRELKLRESRITPLT
jgi:hypothetical protein